MKRRALLAALPAGLYGGTCGAVRMFEPRLVYRPARTLRRTPSDLQMAYEEVWLRSEDGLHLHAWFVPRERARATVLFAHGTSGNLGSNVRRIRAMHDAGFAVLAFDYRGYGRSDGGKHEITEQGTYLDADAAWKWLVTARDAAPEGVVLWGRSLGGGIASWLAARHPARALVLESTFTALDDVAAEAYRWLPARALLRTRYPTEERLPAIGCPVFLAHARDDRRVRFVHAERNLARVKGRAELVELIGGHGAGIAGTPGAIERVAAFLEA